MRPLILGMCSPIPGCLHPRIPGAAGNRLWKMTGMSLYEYELTFERMNVIKDGEWDTETARVRGRRLRMRLRRRKVVVLGWSAWRALCLPDTTAYFLDHLTEAEYYFVPHPSGRNRYYNDPRHRRRVGNLLRRIAA